MLLEINYIVICNNWSSLPRWSFRHSWLRIFRFYLIRRSTSGWTLSILCKGTTVFSSWSGTITLSFGTIVKGITICSTLNMKSLCSWFPLFWISSKKNLAIRLYVLSGGTIKLKAFIPLRIPTNKQLTVLESNFFSYGIYGRTSAGQPQTCRCLILRDFSVHNSYRVLVTVLLGTLLRRWQPFLRLQYIMTLVE